MKDRTDKSNENSHVERSVKSYIHFITRYIP